MSNSPPLSPLIKSEVEKPKQPTIVKKGLLMSAGFYPIATGIMQMGKGMSANPALVTMAMIVLLAVTRSILSQQMSTEKTLNSLRATPIKVYQTYLSIDIIPKSIRSHSKAYLSNARTQQTRRFVDRNPTLLKNNITVDQKTSLFNAINAHQTHEHNIFYTLENNKIDNLSVSMDLNHARKFYPIKSALIEIDFTQDFPHLNKLEALEKVITLIQAQLKKSDSKMPTLSENQGTLSHSMHALLSTIKTNTNDSIKTQLSAFLSEFKDYIHALATSIPQGKTKKDKEEIITQIYHCVLFPELEENNRLIRSRSKTILYGIIPRLIFLAILIGNAATFTVFTQQKGEVLVKSVLQLIDHHLLNMSNVFSATPSIVISIAVALVFSLSTLLISWYFGGDCVKSTLDKIGQKLQHLFKVDNAIKRAYDERKPKDTFWISLSLGCLVAFGSNMVLFDYIRTGDTFTKKIPIGRAGQFYLMLSIFITTTCFFQVLFGNLKKKYIPSIKKRLRYKTDNDGNITEEKRSLLFIGFNIFALLSIIASLCYVLVVSDISKAPEVFKGYDMHNKWAILIAVICVGIFSTVFNVIYSSKALNYIHEKGIALWDKSTTTNKILIAFSAIMLSATMIFISLPASLGSLGFSIIASSAICLLIIATIVSKLLFNHIRNVYRLRNAPATGEKKITLLKNGFIVGLSCVLLSESILINQNRIGENIATHAYDWLLRISAISLGVFVLLKLIHRDKDESSAPNTNVVDNTNDIISSMATNDLQPTLV